MQQVDSVGRTSHRFVFVVALAFAVTGSAHFNEASARSTTIDLTSQARRAGPTLSGSPPTTATVGQAYSFTPTATDPRNRTLRFFISNKPAWATFSSATGALNGTPAAANVGKTSRITITVSDGFGFASLPAFSITVASGSIATNRPPTISGTPATTATVGTAYSFRPTASDPDGNTLTFAVQNKPSWATFSASSGALSGTPTSAQTGTYTNITISVSDGKVSASLAPFTLIVAAAPAASPPTITGTPSSSVTVGSTYSFTPTAKSPTGGTLTFSIQQKPSWASFDATTGTLSGTPIAGNVGTYPGIVLSVSDGKSSAALAAFTITVTAAAGGGTAGSATVSWVAPTQNTDGSPLSNLAGYHVYYGTSATNLSQMQAVSGAGATSAVVGNLTSATTWYFGVKAYTNTGVESVMSSVTSKAIP